MTPPAPMATDLAPKGYLSCRGVKIPRAPILSAGRARKALREGSYERKEADAVMKMVADGDRVLELGTGIGFMSSLIAVHKNVACVETYEANPTLIPYIRQVHALNGVSNRVQVHNALLAPTAGDPVTFYERRNFLASSLDASSDTKNIVAKHQITVLGVNDVIARVAPNVLICDIEGAEADLLPAADLSGLRIAIVELHPQWIGQAGVQAVFDAFHKAGLTYWPKASEGKVVTFRKGW